MNPSLPLEDSRPGAHRYSRVVVVAHSLGAVVARLALLRAHRRSASWLSAVSFVLFSPAHLGADILQLASQSFLGPLVVPVAKWFSPVLLDLEKGSLLLDRLCADTEEALHTSETTSHLVAKTVVHSPRDSIVPLVRFCGDPDAEYVEDHRTHQTVCSGPEDDAAVRFGGDSAVTESADAAIRLRPIATSSGAVRPPWPPSTRSIAEILAKALRPRVSGRVPRATAMRTALDSLLEYASLVEIVHQVSHEAPAWSYKQWTADVLSEPELRLHYERDERQVLPILLRWRLEGFRAPGEPAEVESAGSRLWLFSEFLALNGMLDPPPTESGMEALVRMLCEGATDDGYTLGHLLEAIADHDGSTSVSAAMTGSCWRSSR